MNNIKSNLDKQISIIKLFYTKVIGNFPFHQLFKNPNLIYNHVKSVTILCFDTKRQIAEKDESIKQLEDKVEDTESMLEQKKHEAKKLAKEVKKLKRLLDDEKI